ncbi:MAG: PDZ domain-containing protein [Bryobacteraceae bacterium]
MRHSRLLAAAVLGLSLAPLSFPQALEPIRHTLRFPAPQTNYVEVEASVPTEGKPHIEMMMAVWTPGSYLVREYSRNVENVHADASGKALAVEKTRKNHWSIQTGGAARIHYSYRVYCHEMATQTCFVEAGFAMLNGAPTFMTLSEKAVRRHEVEIVLPSRWSRAMTGLEGGPLKYSAPDFDTLIDSPIIAGNPAVYEWEIDGKKHYLVDTDEAGVFDGGRAARDTEKIVREYKRMFGSLPYSKYVFINMLTEGGGGTEHKNSVLMIASKWATRYPFDPTAADAPAAEGARVRRPSYSGWLGLASHEYFHAFNVKRLRPVELGPFDYDNEVYTRSLWVSEGVTSYYGPLAVKRAGLTTRDEFLRTMGGAISQLQSTPGRLEVPVEQASFDAWIKHYRPNENSANTTISYYTKGEVIGFLLDAKIRKATNGAKSLDDMMKLAYERFGGPRGFTPGEFRKTASEVAGQDLSGWFHTILETTEELDYAEALDWFGLRFRDVPARGPVASVAHGAILNGLVVTQLRRGTPAYDAGLNVNDEIIAVDGFRVTAQNFQTRLEAFQPGDAVSLLVARRDELIKIPLKLGAPPKPWGRLDVRPDATDDQQAHLAAWLFDKPSSR